MVFLITVCLEDNTHESRHDETDTTDSHFEVQFTN